MNENEFLLDEAWNNIKNDFDMSKVSFGRKIGFIEDSYKREILFRDIAQAYCLSHMGYNKPAVILSGGIIEEIIRLFLIFKGENTANKTFDQYIKICEDKKLIKSNIRSLTDSIRQFRNIVHLKNEVSSRETISKATAKTAVSSIFTIVNDLV